MKKQNGFTLIELMIVGIILCILLTAFLPLLAGKSKEKEESKNTNTDYMSYVKKCLNGQTYMVSEKGDVRQLLNQNQEPVICENKLEIETENKIEVNANPYIQVEK